VERIKVELKGSGLKIKKKYPSLRDRNVAWRGGFVVNKSYCFSVQRERD
jgi:hypothetical protein